MFMTHNQVVAGSSRGERGNRTLGDIVFYRCHEFLVLLSKPYKHRA